MRYENQEIVRFHFRFNIFLASCRGNQPSTPQDIPTSEPAGTRAIVLGDISDDPAEVIEGTQPLADHLASHLSGHGITEGQVRIASSKEEMAKLHANGEVDLYFDSAYPATLISDQSGTKVVLLRWRFGVEEYQSVIFASVASGITSIDQLPGYLVAMDAPYSTSGFVLPSIHLMENGLTLAGKKSTRDLVGDNEVGFVSSYDDENTLQWILSGLASAGATDDHNFDVAFPDEAKTQLVELARTEYTPRQVVIIRSVPDPELVQAIVLV